MISGASDDRTLPGRSQHAAVPVLNAWARAGWLRDIDLSFADFVNRHAVRANPLVWLAAALASHQLGRGHPSVDLARMLADPDRALALPPDDDPEVPGANPARPRVRPSGLLISVNLNEWLDILDASGVCGGDGDETPLVRNGSRIYLRRYRSYELSIAAAIAVRNGSDAGAAGVSAAPALVRTTLDAVFRDQPRRSDETDWQRIACAIALRHRFAVITGGPGTGKTTTVIRLLAALQMLARNSPASSQAQPATARLRIGLAAPTGKAAARLNESISSSIRSLDLSALPQGEEIRQAIPSEVVTLHRLLGARRDGYGFRHDRFTPLALDILVIDEASMIDLEMMAAACAALPANARLILIGDKDQLASVEAGALLGGLCERADAGHYLPETAAWISEASGESIDKNLIDFAGTPLDQTIVRLRKSWRFGEHSGIGRLARAVNEGDTKTALQILDSGAGDIEHLRLSPELAATEQARGYHAYLDVISRERPEPGAPPPAWDDWARKVLASFARYRLLAAVRSGDEGVDKLNARITAHLRADGLLGAPGDWYEGRPVMVTRNDHGLGLMNGDVGIVLARPKDEPAERGPAYLRAVFADSARPGSIRWIMPARLRFIETAFALTVHKSQGSEFEHAALLMPQRFSPVLTRELLYTAITRASRRFTLIEPPEARPALELAIATRTARSG